MFDKVMGILLLVAFLVGLTGFRRIWQGDWVRKTTSVVVLVLCLLGGIGYLLRPSLVRDWPWVLMLVVFLLGLLQIRRAWQGEWRAKTDYAVFQLYLLVSGLGFLLDNSVLILVAALALMLWFGVGRYVEKAD